MTPGKVTLCDGALYLVHKTNKYNKKTWSELKTYGNEHQFPGVYFSLVTKQNIHEIELYPGTNCLIFSRRLLEQKNYHLNLRDYNGFITETNTCYPWNMNDAVIGPTNEVVFHHPVPLSYLCLVLGCGDPLPQYPIENETVPDMTKEPFFCYPLERNYTGINPLPESSREFFVRMAKMCDVDSSLSTDEIIRVIKKKLHHYLNVYLVY
jgi:hypothetical protein